MVVLGYVMEWLSLVGASSSLNVSIFEMGLSRKSLVLGKVLKGMSGE